MSDKPKCNPIDCGVQAQIETVMKRFERIADRLSTNQVELRLSLVKLAENMDSVQRVHNRLEKLEEDVKKNSAMMYKIMGIGMAGAAILPIIIKKLL